MNFIGTCIQKATQQRLQGELFAFGSLEGWTEPGFQCQTNKEGQTSEFRDMSKLADESIEVFFSTELLPFGKIIIIFGNFADETEYSGALKAPVRSDGNHQSGARKSYAA